MIKNNLQFKAINLAPQSEYFSDVLDTWELTSLDTYLNGIHKQMKGIGNHQFL